MTQVLVGAQGFTSCLHLSMDVVAGSENKGWMRSKCPGSHKMCALLGDQHVGCLVAGAMLPLCTRSAQR